MSARSRSRLAALRQVLRRDLFAAAPAGERRLGRGKLALIAGLMLALAAGLQLCRIGPGIALESVWAEDGPILLERALKAGFLDALFQPYAGYLILVPRLIGEVGAAVPLREAAAAIAVASALVVALSGLVVWVAAAGLIRNPWLRGTLVALTVLSPVAGLESIADGSYVLWYMLFACFWLLLWKPRTTAGAVLGGLFLLATGLSTPGLWFFAPLAALRLLAATDRRDATLLGGYAIGAAVQIPILAANNETAVDPAWSNGIPISYVQRVLDGGVLGERVGGIGWDLLGWALLGALMLAALVALVHVARRSSTQVRSFTALALGTSLLIFFASTYQRAVGAQMSWPAGEHFGNAGRYAIVPALLLASAVMVAIDRWPRPLPGPQRLPWVGAVAVAVAAVAIATSFYAGDPAARGTPRWGEAIDDAVADCRGADVEEAAIAIAPPGFGLYVSCERLTDAARER